VNSYISRLNFTETTSFNFVLPLCSIRNGVLWIETDEFIVLFTLFAWFQALNSRESLGTILIWHWLVLGQVTTRHPCASNYVDNVITIIHWDCKQNQILLEHAFSLLAEHLSCEGDTVIDIDSDIASLNCNAQRRTKCSLDNISIICRATDWRQSLHKIQS